MDRTDRCSEIDNHSPELSFLVVGSLKGAGMKLGLRHRGILILSASLGKPPTRRLATYDGSKVAMNCTKP